jgi:UDP-N-acetyl-D-mannosaminuronate dehydrogenase
MPGGNTACLVYPLAFLYVVDPFYLTWKAREYGKNTRFVELAGEINRSMPEHVVHRVERSDQAKAGRRDWARDREANR